MRSNVPSRLWLRPLIIAMLVASAAWNIASAELIDRVMAIVAGRVITLSEVNAARAFGLVNIEGAADPLGAAVDQLVERELVLTEVERYAPPEPPARAIEGRMADIRSRFPNLEAFTAALAAAGYTEPRVHDIVRDDVRIQTYLEQRFAAAAEPTDADVARYYREHEAELMVNGALPPMSQIRESVRQTLAAERRRTLVSEWIAGVRRRTEVNVLHLPGNKEGG